MAKPLNILVVMCHPRHDSLTESVAAAFADGAIHAGHNIDWADLYREGFDPVLREEDEPSSDGPAGYSKAVQAEFDRIKRSDAVVMVFPIWWWSMPAMLKGWIDRVWNYGLTYGPGQHIVQRALMIGLSLQSDQGLAKHGYDTAMQTSLDLGILDYCGVPNRDLVLLTGTDQGREHCAGLIAKARAMGEQFGTET